jgi:hypothetical protein
MDWYASKTQDARKASTTEHQRLFVEFDGAPMAVNLASSMPSISMSVIEPFVFV